MNHNSDIVTVEFEHSGAAGIVIFDQRAYSKEKVLRVIETLKEEDVETVLEMLSNKRVHINLLNLIMNVEFFAFHGEIYKSRRDNIQSIRNIAVIEAAKYYLEQ